MNPNTYSDKSASLNKVTDAFANNWYTQSFYISTKSSFKKSDRRSSIVFSLCAGLSYSAPYRYCTHRKCSPLEGVFHIHSVCHGAADPRSTSSETSPYFPFLNVHPFHPHVEKRCSHSMYMLNKTFGKQHPRTRAAPPCCHLMVGGY